MGIAQFDADLETHNKKGLPGFPDGVQYQGGATNRYQRWIRQGMHAEDGMERHVFGHYTKRFGPKLVEA